MLTPSAGRSPRVVIFTPGPRARIEKNGQANTATAPGQGRTRHRRWRGLGWSITRALGRHGARVCLTDNDEGELARAEPDPIADGSPALVRLLDLADLAAVDAVASTWSRLDILILPHTPQTERMLALPSLPPCATAPSSSTSAAAPPSTKAP